MSLEISPKLKVGMSRNVACKAVFLSFCMLDSCNDACNAFVSIVFVVL